METFGFPWFFQVIPLLKDQNPFTGKTRKSIRLAAGPSYLLNIPPGFYPKTNVR